MDDTLTEEQATARLDAHLRAAVGRLRPTPSLEQAFASAMPCDDPDDGGPPGRIFIEAHYWLRDVPTERNRQVFDVLHEYWTANGYGVLSDLRDRPEAPQLKVRHGDDGFSVSLRENLAHELRISGSSPCVWADGHPPADEPATGH
jgi:hypothetical protein